MVTATTGPAPTDRPTGGRVIVGVDGSPGADLALRWAVAHQDRIGPAVPMGAYHIDALVDGVGTPSMYDEMVDVVRRDAEARVAEASRRHPGLVTAGDTIGERPGPGLLHAAAGQRLLVVGSRGRSALAETLLGSVASYCVKHAPVPVAVIPSGTDVDRALDQLVVGVDGSPNAEAALAWAAEHVDDGGRVRAVICRGPGPVTVDGPAPPAMTASDLHTVAAESVERAIGDLDPDRKVTVDIDVLDGDPRLVLRDAAEEASLLVVGARGHRGAAYLLLGSVTTSLIHHPTVPTVVVPTR